MSNPEVLSLGMAKQRYERPDLHTCTQEQRDWRPLFWGLGFSFFFFFFGGGGGRSVQNIKAFRVYGFLGGSLCQKIHRSQHGQ